MEKSTKQQIIQMQNGKMDFMILRCLIMRILAVLDIQKQNEQKHGLR